MFRRQYYKRNTLLRDSSSYYSRFSFIRPKVFSICISISNQTFSCIHCSCMSVGVGHLAEPTAWAPGLACGGAAQWYRSVKVAKYNKYSNDIQINIVKVSLPHTIFWLLRFVKLKPCVRPLNAPVYETSQLVYETSDTKRPVYETSGIRSI